MLWGWLALALLSFLLTVLAVYKNACNDKKIWVPLAMLFLVLTIAFAVIAFHGYIQGGARCEQRGQKVECNSAGWKPDCHCVARP